MSELPASNLGDLLAATNAALNGTSAVLLGAGYVAIRSRRIDWHRRFMIAAVTTSGLFLVSYLTRVWISGTHRFAGPDAARAIYLFVLVTHIVLAILIVPLVLRLLFLAGRERFPEHRRLARITFPMWAYVSVTGLIVYLMLYRVFGYE